ncbi:MAG: alkaline phosphatase family protein [Opitutales bacterium]
MSSSKRKVLLIGWDAADWNVALPLIEAGKMPTLKHLMDHGVWGNLATVRPVLSPMLWTSIATGKRAWKHGILGFTEPCPSTGGIRPITNLSRKTKAVWNIFSQQGWRSNVIGWWPSHPAEPINGVMVSNHFQLASGKPGEDRPLLPGTVYPSELTEPLKEMRIHPAELENSHILPFIPRAAEIDQEKDKRMALCAKVVAEISSIHAAATACMQLEPWEFMAIYYDGIDHFGHGFMKYHPPRRPWIREEDFELYKDVIEGAYRYHDMMLDTLLKLAGEDTTVMLISDHGFEPGNLRPHHLPDEPAGPAAEHSPYGIFVLSGPGIKKNERIHGASLLDIAPTLLHLYGLPVGRDMDGKVLLNSFHSPDPVSYIDSWDDVPGADGRHPADKTVAPVEARESIRQLVALGYIEEPNPDTAVAVDQTVRELQFNLALAYQDAGSLAQAKKILAQQWERWPEEHRFGINLLNCHLALGDAVAARATFEKLVDRKKEDSEKAKKELAALVERHQEDKQQTQSPEPRVQFRMRRLRSRAETNQPAISFFHASILAMENRYDEALETLPDVEQVSDDRKPLILAKRGEIFLTLRRWQEAEGSFKRILKVDPRNAGACLGLARCYFAQKRYFESAGETLSAIELQFHQPRAHFLYGRSLLRLGNNTLAEQVLRTATAQAPYPAAHTLLAYIYRHRLKHEDRAVEHDRLAREAKRHIYEKRHRLESETEADTSFDTADFIRMDIITNRLGSLGETGSNPLIVVSGLPRSGTSLMMQMLDAGGLDVVSDQARLPDASNPRGYFEDERVKKMHTHRRPKQSEAEISWLEAERGKAIKIVAPLLQHVPESIPMKVIFMERAAGEILASQRTMLARDGKSGAQVDDAAIARSFDLILREVNKLCNGRPNVEVLPVAYAEAVSSPQKVAAAVAEFLGHTLKLEAMTAVADPQLYRTK